MVLFIFVNRELNEIGIFAQSEENRAHQDDQSWQVRGDWQYREDHEGDFQQNYLLERQPEETSIATKQNQESDSEHWKRAEADHPHIHQQSGHQIFNRLV